MQTSMSCTIIRLESCIRHEHSNSHLSKVTLQPLLRRILCNLLGLWTFGARKCLVEDVYGYERDIVY